MSNLRLGIDVGSTTVKLALVDENNELIYSDYRRHHSDIRAAVRAMFDDARDSCGTQMLDVAITGSGGLTLAQWLKLEFVQEVVASKKAVDVLIPQTDVAIELGGEDAKIIYLTNGMEQRMNGTCAGGTGAFIDQMATLLNTDATGLNEYSKGAQKIYPIASRCGVFAKSDIQPLLNEGAAKEDIAASVYQSVVTQTISGLACGRPIRGYVAFLGGPLQYLSGLRETFIKTLKLDDEHAISPTDAHLFVARGAAYTTTGESVASMPQLVERLVDLGDTQTDEVERLAPLFATPEDYEEFHERHSAETVKRGDIRSYHGKVYIGIDAGSTTMKGAVIGEDGELLTVWYDNNFGDVMGTAKTMLEDLRAQFNDDVEIAHVTCTGYGEGLLKEGLHADSGEVETVAHLRGAQAFDPDVDSILDIGGQDMKFIQIKDGAIDSILLNESCSSGCGSFVASFADGMNIPIADFAQKALGSTKPVDLGSRCTVFMNSRVKQAQKEGAGPEDISAGLSYAVVKNCLFKVIKLRDPEQLGKKVVVQGGTFLNDAVLRAFEQLTERKVIRPDISGNMGAYGAALIARENATGEPSSLLTPEEIGELHPKITHATCGICPNHCKLTITNFGGGHRFTTGNRCEKGAGHVSSEEAQAPDLFKWKRERLFDYYTPLDADKARGVVGIPRALNMYENYPFWFTFWNALGYRVELTGESDKALYESGIESMPDESVCYPAKLSHGHVMQLINKKVDFIWFPCVRWERKENEDADNHFNCPVVMSYPSALKMNIDQIIDGECEFLDPFVPYHDKIEMRRRMFNILKERGEDFTRAQVSAAVEAAWDEDLVFHADVHKAGEDTLQWMEDHDARGIVLAGRPYHLDHEVNHSIPELINSYGFAVLTEDSVAHIKLAEHPIRIVDQWTYHTRLFACARLCSTRNDLDMVQLNSFGCGLDALCTDQVEDILAPNGKLLTVLKIDEVSNLGTVRIRIRSLIAALKQQHDMLVEEELKRAGIEARENVKVPVHRENTVSAQWPRVEFTAQMKEDRYTILAPQMAPIHFELLEPIFDMAGYNLVILPSLDHKATEVGLKYVNNDICYPSILTTGQLLEAVLSGDYDMTRTACLISQTGGGCRATNYISLIRKALVEAGYPDVPVISLSAGNTNELPNSGFKMTPDMVRRAVYALILGDLLMQVRYRVRPYEAVAGSTDELYEKWNEIAKKELYDINRKSFKKLTRDIISAFDNLECVNFDSKPRVGIVGEILVKYHPTANNQIIEAIESEGCEAVIPGMMEFFLYSMMGPINFKESLGSKASSRLKSRAMIGTVYQIRKPVEKMLTESKRFSAPEHIQEMADQASELISICNSMGEGWLLPAEMIELINTGVPNIACIQPFGCLPNHVVGKAVIKELRSKFPQSNFVAIDYDPGASEVNQLNRLKLMVSVAKENQAREVAKQVAHQKDFVINSGWSK